jgi:hypothetical protein
MATQIYLDEQKGNVHTYQGEEVSFPSLELMLVTNVSMETPSEYSQERFIGNTEDTAKLLAKAICADYFLVLCTYSQSHDISLSTITANFYRNK